MAFLMVNQDRDYIFSKLFEHLAVKKEIKENKELIRPILPVREWVKDPYYVGEQGLSLYPFWRKVIEDVFKDDGELRYNICIAGGGIGCRPLNTKYETTEGYLSLEQISQKIRNTSVFVNTENGKERIVATHIVGEKEIIRITLSNGVVFEGSDDHLIRVFDGSSILFKKLRDLEDSDCVLVSSVDRTFIKEEYSLEEAYFTGSVLGDGSIGKDGLEFIWSCENEGCEDIKSIITNLFPDRNIRSYYKSSGFHYYDVRVKDREKINRLFESDYSTAYTKHIPSWVFSSSDRIIWEFVAGLFDTDGFIDKRGVIQLTSASERLIRGLHSLLLLLGVTSSIQKIKKNCGSFEGQYYNITITQQRSRILFKKNCHVRWKFKRDRLNSIRDSYNRNCKTILHGLSGYMADNMPKLVIPRRLDSFKRYRYKTQEITLETVLSMNDHYPDWVNSSNVLSYIVKNRCYFVKIKQKENIGLGIVGDIEVEGSHTYISDGIINHNTGKSTAGVYLMVRFLYELSCYNNIHKHLGLRMDTSALVLLLFCITKKQIKNTTFKKLKETIDDIPYFKEHFPRYERVNDELRFPKNVLVLYGSGTGDALGLDLCASLVDEANFFSDASGNSTDMSEVADLHRSLIARQESRFMSNGKNRALSIVVSSSTYSSGYTEELKKRSLTDPTIKYYRARLWDVRPKGTYSSEVFYVFCGNDKVDPFIINDVMDLSARLNARVNPNMSIKEAISLLPNDLRVLVDDVPIDFRRQYDVNLLKSIQDVSGFSIQGTGGLFNNRAVFDACIDYSLPVLFTKNEFVIETQNDSPQNSIMYYLSGVPFSHPECPRFVHVDLSLSTDTTGISCCYKYGEKEVDGVLRPVYYYDFCIRILPPPPPKKISIARVEEFIMYMRDRLHITFGMISYDSFQSSSSQQHLQELGFPIRTQSVDRTDKAYLFFVDQMFLGTVKFNLQFANVIEHELFNLQHNRQKHKVDHILDTAHGYTKDVCDAVVGSLYNILECSPKEINNDDTLSLAYYNSSGNHARFTEESSWLFEEDSRAEQIKEIMEQEYGFMYRKGIL